MDYTGRLQPAQRSAENSGIDARQCSPNAACLPALGPNLLIRKSQYLQVCGAGLHINPPFLPHLALLFCEFCAFAAQQQWHLLRLSQVGLGVDANH